MGCEIESNDRRVPNAVDITAAEIPLACTQEWSPQVPKKIYIEEAIKGIYSENF